MRPADFIAATSDMLSIAYGGRRIKIRVVKADTGSGTKFFIVSKSPIKKKRLLWADTAAAAITG